MLLLGWCDSCPACPQVILDETRKNHVYNQYYASMRATDVVAPRIARADTFFKIWKSQYGHMKLSAQRTIDSKCTVCEDLKVQAGAF